MLRIKRLYLYILQTFLPMFFMTFGICLFILLMQFVWKYVEDFVGKGLDTVVLGEMFLYAALSTIPMALPLAILLASLMTFGNMGEQFELLAIKASGTSLLKAMRPLIVLIFFVSIGAFFFQNEAMPKINVKVTSLLRSIKMKSPELDIPEGSFYSDINNYNLYVEKKNKETGMMYEVKIYDRSKGFDNMAVIVCDSAKMRMSSGKDYLLLNLFYGQQFANFQKPGATPTYGSSVNSNNKFVPYGRENFKEKEIVISFDASFNRMDESSLQGTQIAKNIKELQIAIDSLSYVVDSMNIVDRKVIADQAYRNIPIDTSKVVQPIARVMDLDSIIGTLTTSEMSSLYSEAFSQSDMNKGDLLFRSMDRVNSQAQIRYHNVEWHRKFTLSFACLIFFFIGAPLGAIIRKGGLGMPVVISVILFIVYYIFDNIGRKMARDGVWDVWQGIWLSSFILFPLGVFLTYKAMNDSALFNMDAYRNLYNKKFGDPKDKTPKALFDLFSKNSGYTLIAYIAVIALYVVGNFAKGFLATFTDILLWLSVISYVLLLWKTYFELTAFYENANQKIKMKDIIFFCLGIPLFFISYIYFKNKIKIKKIYNSYSKKTETI